FIGLGTMGAPMAKRLANAGHKMSVYDVNSKVASEFVDLPLCRAVCGETLRNPQSCDW
ncbi:MAG: hypothetical protein HOL57_12350, partial [Marinovum sp.]|nr:hypothetical protein [Marinovum sp.]